MPLLTSNPAAAAGFQFDNAPDPAGNPLPLAIWYPSEATPSLRQFGPISQTIARGGAISGTKHPLIVFSHGTGGSNLNSAGTAIALADAGFIVAAVQHAGDNYQDRSVSFSEQNFINRPRQVSRVIDYMLKDWQGHAAIDASRIGIFGHSAAAAPADPIVTGADKRIKAAVIAAPAVDAGFLPDGLAAIASPVQLWIGTEDTIVPEAKLVLPLFHEKIDYHLIPNGGHFAYLDPCSESLAAIAPEICQDPQGFDRASFLAGFQHDVITFFQEKLVKTALPPP